MLSRSLRRRPSSSHVISPSHFNKTRGLSGPWRIVLQLSLITLTIFVTISPFVFFSFEDNDFVMHRYVGDGTEQNQIHTGPKVPSPSSPSPSPNSFVENVESSSPATQQTQIRRGIANYGVFQREDIPYLWETVPQMVSRMKSMPRRGRDTIFVSIASYRDDKCVQTLADLFHKCKHCHRVYVGIADQIEDGDMRCLPPDEFKTQVTLLEMPASESKYVTTISRHNHLHHPKCLFLIWN